MSDGKTVIITGAGGSLGRALASTFARNGYQVAGIDCSEEQLGRFTASLRELGGRHLPLNCDLRQWSAIRQAVADAAQEYGRIDVVINSATARTSPVYKPLEHCTEEEVANIATVGPHAALGMMIAALPHLKAVQGTVINIGSAAGATATAGFGPYGMAKAALHTLTKCAAREWGKYGIRVNGVLPLVMTETLAAQMQSNPEQFNHILPPLGRLGDGERDIGSVALFLASEAAGYITGQNIPVDGGGYMV
jgi:NAD(P)-dependent dehydrogenase (short-subunit alcohol dehydrogenase family)